MDLGYLESSHEKDGTKRVLRWDLETGEDCEYFNLGTPSDSCYALAGHVIVTSDRRILDSLLARISLVVLIEIAYPAFQPLAGSNRTFSVLREGCCHNYQQSCMMEMME